MEQENEERKPIAWFNANEQISIDIDECCGELIVIDYLKALRLKRDLTIAINDFNERIKEIYGTN